MKIWPDHYCVLNCSVRMSLFHYESEYKQYSPEYCSNAATRAVKWVPLIRLTRVCAVVCSLSWWCNVGGDSSERRRALRQSRTHSLVKTSQREFGPRLSRSHRIPSNTILFPVQKKIYKPKYISLVLLLNIDLKVSGEKKGKIWKETEFKKN